MTNNNTCRCGHDKNKHFNNQECIDALDNGMQCPCKKFEAVKLQEYSKTEPKYLFEKTKKGCGKLIYEDDNIVCGDKTEFRIILCPKCKPQNHGQQSGLESVKEIERTPAGTFNLSEKIEAIITRNHNEGRLISVKYLKEDIIELIKQKDKEFIRIICEKDLKPKRRWTREEIREIIKKRAGDKLR